MDITKFANLVVFIQRHVVYTPQELIEVLPYIKVLYLKKNQIFISEGEIASHIAFTNKGYLRVFYNFDGEEITRDITPLHSFATALPSFISQKPSWEIISAITDCELFVITKDDLDIIYEKHPKWERLGRRIIEDMFVDAQSRLYQFITLSAEVRYREFIRRYPDIIREVPLKYIADYLGIKIQSLSRLRKGI
jgi:CRP/FNR family transcriptional regulator, anaerobic regulatory protein